MDRFSRGGVEKAEVGGKNDKEGLEVKDEMNGKRQRKQRKTGQMETGCTAEWRQRIKAKGLKIKTGGMKVIGRKGGK